MSNDEFKKKALEKENIEKFDESDFEFVHMDKTEKIHDEELKTKPTTFAKDALKRFVKNKASVVGAVIIGVLLLASIFSFVSPHKIGTPIAEIARLHPKIRGADNGFWDGTEWFVDKIYDEENETPYNVEAKNIVPGTLTISDEKTYYDNDPNPYATGGYYRVTADSFLGGARDTFYLTNYNIKKLRFDVSNTDDLKLTFKYGGVQNIGENNRLAAFNVYLTGKDDADYDMANNVKILLGSDYYSESGEDETATIDNIGEKMLAAGYPTVYAAQIRLEFNAFADAYGYILVETFEATCSENASDKLKTRLSEISFDDANWLAGHTTPDSYIENYWQSNGNRLIYHAYARKCTYLYDQYEAVLGIRKDVVIGGTILKQYIANGWCTMSDFNDISTFKLTNPDSNECPLRSITDVRVEGAGTENPIYQFDGEVLYYRYLGYDSMPFFIFGTDTSGRDMLTLSLSCLKNSLFLAIITSAVCLIIGLVWGSVSGYFGGNTDLFMERITDILSGVPWIVVMTLVMLLLGRTYVTFGIAICLTGWIGTASRTRTQFYRFKGREYVLASRTLGASDGRLIFRHILPNGLGTIVTGSVLMIPSTIFSEATLSYLGLGLQGTASFGVVLAENQSQLNSRPMLIIWPSIIISLLMISFNLFGNGLRDALNPTLKGGEQ